MCFAFTAVYTSAQAPAAFPLLRSCSADAVEIATLQATDPVKVRYSFSGDPGTCYAVTATVEGKPVEGYLIGRAHPAIAAFEHAVQTEGVIVPAPAPPAPVKAAVPAAASAKPAAPPAPAVEAPTSFAGFHAVTVDGFPVDLSRQRAANVVIYFWSARSRAGVQAADYMESLYDTYHTRSVYMVGVASAASADQLRAACAANEIIWPQVLDRGGLAAHYHVNPAKPYLVLDQNRNVIAAEPTATALQPVLAQITKGRRIHL